jgi:hypothetical protein
MSRRKQSWMRSQSDGFRPIRQIGVATSFGLPLMGVGILLLVMAWSVGGTFLWILAAGLFVAGLLAAASNRIT